MQYRKHRPDGDFDDSGLEPVEWSYDKELARRKGGSNG